MDDGADAPLTQTLERWNLASDADKNRVIEVLYQQLKQRAAMVRAARGGGRTIEPTVLVNEVYIKLLGTNMQWQGRGHFLNVASKLMRQVIVDIARYENAQKRDRGAETILRTNLNVEQQTISSVVDIDALLQRLATIDETYVSIVEARVFAGLTIADTAAALAISPATVKRKWKTAQIWLYEQLLVDE